MVQYFFHSIHDEQTITKVATLLYVSLGFEQLERSIGQANIQYCLTQIYLFRYIYLQISDKKCQYRNTKDMFKVI